MLEKMKEIIADQLSVEVENVTEASSFKEDLGADSLDLFNLAIIGYTLSCKRNRDKKKDIKNQSNINKDMEGFLLILKYHDILIS